MVTADLASSPIWFFLQTHWFHALWSCLLMTSDGLYEHLQSVQPKDSHVECWVIFFRSWFVLMAHLHCSLITWTPSGWLFHLFQVHFDFQTVPCSQREDSLFFSHFSIFNSNNGFWGLDIQEKKLQAKCKGAVIGKGQMFCCWFPQQLGKTTSVKRRPPLRPDAILLSYPLTSLNTSCISLSAIMENNPFLLFPHFLCLLFFFFPFPFLFA